MFKRSFLLLSVFLMCLVVSSCATTGPQTPDGEPIIWINVYAAQYDDAMTVMKNPQSTQAQKDVAQKKKAILIKAWPLLKVFAATVDSGAVPSANDTAQITDLINQLVVSANEIGRHDRRTEHPGGIGRSCGRG